MGFLGAGLLQGLGAGFTQLAAQRREDALIALRRQQQQEDRAHTEQREDVAAERDAKLKVGLLTLAQEYKKQEQETEQQYQERLLRIKGEIETGQIRIKGEEERKTTLTKGQVDQKLEGFKFANQRALEQFKSELGGKEVSDINAQPDGTMVVTFKDGTTKVQRDVKIRQKGSGADDEEGGTIAAAQARAGGAKGVASATTGKTMTAADIEATASARGISKEKARMILEGLGYRLVN